MQKISFCLILVVLTLPDTGYARDYNALPGYSGISEYVETIPDASGQMPSQVLKSNSGAISSQVEKQLQAAGKSGAKVAQLAQATAPHDSKTRLSKSALVAEPSLYSALSSGIVPPIMALSLIAAVIVAILRRGPKQRS